MLIIKKGRQEVLVRIWRNCNPPTLLVEMLNCSADVENSLGVLLKVKHTVAM